MTINTVDWSGAWIGRLQRKDETRHDGRCEELSARLYKDIDANKLPFINLPYREELEKGLIEHSPWLQSFEHMLLLGIGGSALGPRALQRAFFPEQDMPNHEGKQLWISDNVDAGVKEEWLKRLPAEKTVVVVISKSGGTIETIAQYFIVREWLKTHLGDAWTDHVMLITDAHNGYLREEVQRLGVRSMPVPDNLGGRYSVLSAVGLVPAAFLGIDWKALLDGAMAVSESLCKRGCGELTMKTHPSWRIASWAKTLMEEDYNIMLFFTYVPQWASFGDWFAQLWAESLGKDGKGSTPLPAKGVTDQHSTQQLYLGGPRDKGCMLLSCPTQPEGLTFADDLPDKWEYLRGEKFGELLHAETLGSRMALGQTDTPLIELRVGETTEVEAGRLIAMLEIATVLTGWLLDINPLNQPHVELGKRLANARLGASGYDKESKELEHFLGREPNLQEF
ncbi:MAG: glucose-6-phosphate isomerase [Desulfovibrionales bacterium]|nr:glucose-6-phosphate isomerase [Desulfovibrionales bacterium]